MLPPTGDAEIAVPYFAANRAATIRNSRDQPFWFLTMMAVRRDVQKRGVGTALMRHGVDKADEEGWQALTNATPEGKFLYEKFGFSVVDQTDVADGLVTYHMRREAKPKAT
jgi:predicted N-acetyltransferase YhbS